jgi:hypothetical protein
MTVKTKTMRMKTTSSFAKAKKLRRRDGFAGILNTSAIDFIWVILFGDPLLVDINGPNNQTLLQKPNEIRHALRKASGTCPQLSYG